MSAVFNIKEHIIDAAHIREFHRATANSQDEKLKLHVKEYIPKDNLNPQKGDITVIGGHANGFPKGKADPFPPIFTQSVRKLIWALVIQELYEPLWEEFYHEAKSRNIRIRSILIADAAWQGQSGILNRESLGNDPGWLDNARDTIHLINTLRPPTPIFGIGHSFGANTLTNVALMHPRLLTSLVLLDPVISHYASSPDSKIAGPAAASIVRREFWPSRNEAEAAFKRSRFYQSWDPRVLDRWVKFGITDVPGEEAVTLTTTKHQELFTFLRPSWDAYAADGKTLIRPELIPDVDPSLNEKWPTYPYYRSEGANTLARLPNLRPDVLYVFGGQSDISPEYLQDEKMELTGSGVGGSGGAKAGRVTKVVGDKYGHLIPMENPKFCAQAAAIWIKTELDRWWADERQYEEWTKKSTTEKTTVSDDWYKYLGKEKKSSGNPKPKI